MTFVDLEFETAGSRGAPLGDIASSLVTIDELLRDLATISADPSTAEFREVRVVAIELRNPLKVKLSLFAIPAEAVRAFEEICRDIIVFRERRADSVGRIATTLGLNDTEAKRLHGLIVSLRTAAVPLKRVIVTDAAA